MIKAPLPSPPRMRAEVPRNGQAIMPKPRRIRAWHVAGLLLLLVTGGLMVYAFWPTVVEELSHQARQVADDIDDAAARVEVVVVAPVAFPLRAEATGHLAPWRSAEISAEAGGLVTERLVEEGHQVAQGVLLLRLDERDRQIELQEAEAELLKAQAEYAAKSINERQITPGDTTQLARAREAYEAAQQAFEQDTISQAVLNEAARTYKLAQIRSGMQRDAVQAAFAGLTQAETHFERARLALSRTRITAPFTGRIADLEVESDQHVGAGQKLFTLLEDDRMKVEVDVLEADLVQLHVGATARVRVPALDKARFSGTIYAINPRIDPQTGTGRVTVALPNPQGRLMAGLFAYVELETQRLSKRLVVPTEAVLARQGRDLVFSIKEGRAQWVYVKVGARSGDAVEIAEGLSPGDTVAVAGHFALAHDAPVEVALAREIENL